jgi:hypothetical protein
MCCHMSRSSELCLPVEEGSGVITCPVALDLASILRRAPVPPHVPQLRTRLPTNEGSGVVMCPIALDPTSLLRRAPVPPCVL